MRDHVFHRPAARQSRFRQPYSRNLRQQTLPLRPRPIYPRQDVGRGNALLPQQRPACGHHNQLMLGGVHPRLKIRQGILFPNRYRHGGNDFARIHFRDSIVHHTAAVRNAPLLKGGIGPLNGVSSGKVPRQRGMQVDDLLGKAFEKGGAENVHPARQHNQIGPQGGYFGG